VLFISRFVSHRLASLLRIGVVADGYSLHCPDVVNSWTIDSLADDLGRTRRSLTLCLICWVNGKPLTILALWKCILAVSRATGSWALTVVMLWLLIPLTKLRVGINDLRVLEVDGLGHSADSSTNELIDIAGLVLQGRVRLIKATAVLLRSSNRLPLQLALQRRTLITWLLWRL